METKFKFTRVRIESISDSKVLMNCVGVNSNSLIVYNNIATDDKYDLVKEVFLEISNLVYQINQYSVLVTDRSNIKKDLVTEIDFSRGGEFYSLKVNFLNEHIHLISFDNEDMEPGDPSVLSEFLSELELRTGQHDILSYKEVKEVIENFKSVTNPVINFTSNYYWFNCLGTSRLVSSPSSNEPLRLVEDYFDPYKIEIKDPVEYIVLLNGYGPAV